MCPTAGPDRLTVMAVVSVLSLKGGVGKTSVVLGLAGAVVDDWGSLWTTLCKHVEVCHGVMTTLSLLLGHFSKINVLQVGLHL